MQTTISIQDELYRKLKMHADETNQTISAIIEDATYRHLEDLDDLQAVNDRANEPTMDFNELVKDIGSKGLL